jgi:hypothetical protein
VGTKRQELAKLVTGIPVTKRKVASIIFSDDIQASVRRAFHQPLTEIDLIYLNVSSATSAYPYSRLIISAVVKFAQIVQIPARQWVKFGDLEISL